MKQNRNTLKNKIMKHTITIETKKEIEITLPHYFKINSAYYAAVSEDMAISIFSMRDINVFSFANIILRHIESPEYIKISALEFEEAMTQTFFNIKEEYLNKK
jgi:CRISPR/Cas system endoribonuclease Cas6 (RAMP superfamily)